MKITNGNCLGDEHIYLAKRCKKGILSLGGLHLNTLTKNNSFCPAQSAADSIQIHYKGKFRWVTSTSVDGSINLNDSVYNGISSSLQV